MYNKTMSFFCSHHHTAQCTCLLVCHIDWNNILLRVWLLFIVLRATTCNNVCMVLENCSLQNEPQQKQRFRARRSVVWWKHFLPSPHPGNINILLTPPTHPYHDVESLCSLSLSLSRARYRFCPPPRPLFIACTHSYVTRGSYFQTMRTICFSPLSFSLPSTYPFPMCTHRCR